MKIETLLKIDLFNLFFFFVQREHCVRRQLGNSARGETRRRRKRRSTGVLLASKQVGIAMQDDQPSHEEPQISSYTAAADRECSYVHTVVNSLCTRRRRAPLWSAGGGVSMYYILNCIYMQSSQLQVCKYISIYVLSRYYIQSSTMASKHAHACCPPCLLTTSKLFCGLSIYSIYTHR